MINIISKRNDSANIILLCIRHDWVSILFNLPKLGSADTIKPLIKWNNQKMIGEIHLKTKSICVLLASVFKSHLPKGQFRLPSLKIFRS